MIHGVKNNPVDESFTVSDIHGNLISGIDSTEFTVYVYDPTGTNVTASVSGFFTELGDGNYKYTFTPNLNKIWYVVVTHATYFPWGKTDDVYVEERDLTGIYEIVIRTLGLSRSDFYVDETTYDNFGNLVDARVRIYSDPASVGTVNDVIDTYRMTSDGTACGQFSFWKQVKI